MRRSVDPMCTNVVEVVKAVVRIGAGCAFVVEPPCPHVSLDWRKMWHKSIHRMYVW